MALDYLSGKGKKAEQEEPAVKKAKKKRETGLAPEPAENAAKQTRKPRERSK